MAMNYTNLVDAGADGFFDKKLDIGFVQKRKEFFGVAFDNG